MSQFREVGANSTKMTAWERAFKQAAKPFVEEVIEAGLAREVLEK